MESILYSERLNLKELGAPDAEAVLDYLYRNREVLGPWERTKEPEYYTLEYQRELLHQESEKIASGDLCKWWIFRQEEPERVIGSVALSNIVRGAFQSCHMGYGLDGKEQRKGYMTEAVRRVTLYAFAEPGFTCTGSKPTSFRATRLPCASPRNADFTMRAWRTNICTSTGRGRITSIWCSETKRWNRRLPDQPPAR